MRNTLPVHQSGEWALFHKTTVYSMWELCEEIKEMMYIVFCSGRLESYVYVGMSDIDVSLKYMYK